METKVKLLPTVIYIITKLELGGAQKVCIELFKNFSPNSYLISSNDGLLAGQFQDNPNFISAKYLQRDISWKTIFFEPLAFFELLLILIRLKNKHPNLIVHTHSSKAGILGRLAAWFAGVKKIIHTVHGFAIFPDQNKLSYYLFKTLEQIATFCSSSIICVSKNDLELGTKLFYGFEKKATIIRASIDEAPFLELREEAAKNRFDNIVAGNFVIGTVSCFKPQKNLIDLLKAFCLARKLAPTNFPKLVLEIIGDGIEREKIENFIKKHKLSSSVKLFGWQENVATIMSRWNLFTLSSLWEGLPCSLVQAQILGQRSACYDAGGVFELISDPCYGFLIPRKNIFLLSEAFLKNKNINYVFNSTKIDNFFLDKMLCLHANIYS